MATLQTRPFSKNYSGLINQSVVAVGLVVICIAGHDLMKRKRRGKGKHLNRAASIDDGDVRSMGSVESWEFGYLYQGRCWSKNPSPPHPKGWPLSWVKSVLTFPEDRLSELRGLDATVYIRFLRGCWWFVLLHTFTTFPVLFPIHIVFSDGDGDSSKSMTRASISSLTQTAKGRSLLWIHLIIIIWVTSTWIFNLMWIVYGALKFRAIKIDAAANKLQEPRGYHPHPHPTYFFRASPDLNPQIKKENRGLRLRTVMVSNLPPNLRSEKELKEYFQYYLCRKIARPAMGVTSNMQPGMINRYLSHFLNRIKKDPYGQRSVTPDPESAAVSEEGHSPVVTEGGHRLQDHVVIERVNIVRKMSELASLLERREDVLRILETNHIKLAKKVVSAVATAMEERSKVQAPRKSQSRTSMALLNPVKFWRTDAEKEEDRTQEGTEQGEGRLNLLVRTIGPFVHEFQADKLPSKSWRSFLSQHNGEDGSGPGANPNHKEGAYPPYAHGKSAEARQHDTIWDALLSLPRSTLDPYQPLLNLSSLFRGKTVPSIDYYTAKLNLLTSMITEHRSRAMADYMPVSTAFVTFANPNDARRACKYLAVNPHNPLTCLVTMAPLYEDVDWIRIMKLPFRVEFVKDWVIDIGVWAFTILWVFPTSLFVGLVSIQNISAFWPGLKHYLDGHPWESEVIQSFLPTFLIALLALLIPLLLLLIAKKAHTISTLSALHDLIMTRYYKFLVVNVLVFFCVGTVTLQSFLVSFRSVAGGDNIIKVISDSFPSAGPFYVGWQIFTTAIHGGFEIALFGLPLIMYPSTKRQVTPRKRTVGIRPRTFNYYYWLPNHIFVIHVLLLFSTLNPLVIPFGLVYFSVENTVVKNSLLHVYAKNYEGNGIRLIIRIVRYSLDGLVFAQAVFLAYMVVNEYKVNIGVTAVLIILTVATKLVLTRWIRARYEEDDIREANIVCGTDDYCAEARPEGNNLGNNKEQEEGSVAPQSPAVENTPSKTFWTWKIPARIRFSYSTIPNRPYRRQPNPFAPTQVQRSASMDVVSNSPIPSESVAHRAIMSVPSFDIRDMHVEEERHSIAEEPDVPGRVVRQPPHPTWDDESHLDQPYENPYYTLPFDNALWLPRNPCGLLDLDDTVNMYVSLTSEAVAGRLGVWIDQTQTVASGLSGLTEELESSMGSVDGHSIAGSERVAWPTGNEDISLSPGIAARVQNLDQELDIETTPAARKPSILSRRRPSNATSRRVPSLSINNGSLPSAGLQRPVLQRPTLRATSSGSQPSPEGSSPNIQTPIIYNSSPESIRPGTADSKNSPGYRSFSYGSRRTTSSGPPSSYFPDERHRTISNEFGLNPTSDQRLLGSVMSMRRAPSSVDAPSHARSGGAVSTFQAVVHEVIDEEMKTEGARKTQEEEEAAKTKKPRSWLTAWMFSSPWSSTHH